MFFSNQDKKVRKEKLSEANSELQALVESALQENMPFIKAEVPEDKQEEFIESLRQEFQLRAIEMFKEKVKEIADREQRQKLC